MSRAFIKEDAGDPDELPERHQSAAPNYMTPEGLAALRRQAVELRERLAALPKDGPAAREAKRDLRYYEGRVASAIPVDPRAGLAEEVRFGATVSLRGQDGQTLRRTIVGQDEAEGAPDKLAWDSALALALLGAKPGGRIETEDFGMLTVEDIRYPGR